MYEAEVYLIMDQYQRHTVAVQEGRKENPAYEAETLRQHANVLGRYPRCIAFIAEEDLQGLTAYSKAGFETRRMNGDRPERVREFTREMRQVLRTNPPKNLVLVSPDRAFEPLLDNATATKETEVQVWAPQAEVALELAEPEYHFRPLEELLPKTKEQKVDVRVDYENAHYGLQQRGLPVEPKQVIAAIKTACESLGRIVSITAYADWDVLDKDGQYKYQRELASLGVDTRYQLNIRGKNSADMKLADDIRTLAERGNEAPDSVDTIMLVTNDRDFRPAVETARARGKRMIVMGLKRGLSAELLRVVGDDVRYLDDYLTMTKPVVQIQASARPEDPLARFALELALLLRRNGWKWTYLSIITRELKLESNSEILKGAFAGEVITCRTRTAGGEPETLMLNPAHPLAATAQRLIWWVPGRVDYNLKKGLPYVDSAFLARGMYNDPEFARLGTTQTRADVDGWLDILAATTVIVKKQQVHPKTPGKLINTWWPPELASNTNSQSSARPNEAAEAEHRNTRDQQRDEQKEMVAPAAGHHQHGTNWPSPLITAA